MLRARVHCDEPLCRIPRTGVTTALVWMGGRVKVKSYPSLFFEA